MIKIMAMKRLKIGSEIEVKSTEGEFLGKDFSLTSMPRLKICTIYTIYRSRLAGTFFPWIPFYPNNVKERNTHELPYS